MCSATWALTSCTLRLGTEPNNLLKPVTLLQPPIVGQVTRQHFQDNTMNVESKTYPTGLCNLTTTWEKQLGPFSSL
jgi:hypothetical protein